MRIHTGDKPYMCLCCKKAFARTDALSRHFSREEACGKSAVVQASLRHVVGRRQHRKH
ncbi:hypothetical protein J3Q64DRAFT_1710357 [Phycomyces blakesleeanus]|uniref:C2H2-type zinc finger transcription factor n=1 Tax=Phycomyces blakesleeanus TaxID=4837 RepID=A0ABR3BEW9_PHYBL